MSKTATLDTTSHAANRPSSGHLLQRACACGVAAGLSGECEECKTKKLLGKPLQTKLAVSQPGDEFEQEANRVAMQVLKMPERPETVELNETVDRPLIRRQVAPSPGTTVGYAPPIVHEVLASPGQPLDSATRAFFEPRFGHNFGNVRVHADTHAQQSARAINAHAYTVGHDVVFGESTGTLATIRSRQLLAHELTHVVQQGSIESYNNTTVEDMRTQSRRYPSKIMRQTSPGPSPVSFGEARATGGEAGMGFSGYSSKEGWAFLSGPGGSAGHRWNEPGFDGVAFRTRGKFEIHILDNKSLARAGNINSSSALTRNLLSNLDELIATASQARLNNVPQIAQIRTSLQSVRIAVSNGQPLPSHTKLVITNFGGRSTGITARLASQGIIFRDLMAPMVPSPSSPLRGAGGTPGAQRGSLPLLNESTSSRVPSTGAPASLRQSPKVASSAASEIARKSASSARWGARMLRAVTFVQGATKVIAFVSDVSMFREFTGMARSGLAGKGFILTKYIQEADELSAQAQNLVSSYPEFESSLNTLSFQLLKASWDPESAGQAFYTVSEIRAELGWLNEGLRAQMDRINSSLLEVIAEQEAAENILNDPKASGIIAGLTFGSAKLARLFAVSQDLGRIHGALASAQRNFQTISNSLSSDIRHLVNWENTLFGICEKGGLCSSGTIELPFVGTSAWRVGPFTSEK